MSTSDFPFFFLFCTLVAKGQGAAGFYSFILIIFQKFTEDEITVLQGTGIFLLYSEKRSCGKQDCVFKMRNRVIFCESLSVNGGELQVCRSFFLVFGNFDTLDFVVKISKKEKNIFNFLGKFGFFCGIRKQLLIGNILLSRIRIQIFRRSSSFVMTPPHSDLSEWEQPMIIDTAKISTRSGIRPFAIFI